MLEAGFYNLDCMEGMAQFPDGFFDLAIVDPPYGISADTFNNGSGASKDKGHKYGTAVRCRRDRVNDGRGKLRNRPFNRADCSWDREPPPPEYFRELFRVSKNRIIWGGNYFDLPPTRCVVVWDKMQPWENFSQVEIAWTSFDKPAALFRMSNTMAGKIHPTQKPVELYQWLLNRFARPGMKILDTHVGSASSLVACQRAGIEYWGFEIDPSYFGKASVRLEQEKAQVSMMELMRQATPEPEQIGW